MHNFRTGVCQLLDFVVVVVQLIFACDLQMILYKLNPSLNMQSDSICTKPGGEETRPGTKKKCSHNLESDPLGSGLKKVPGNFLQ